LPFGCCSTLTFVIFPAVTLIWTCTGPQRVEATDPVYVFVPEELLELPEDGVLLGLPDGVPVDELALGSALVGLLALLGAVAAEVSSVEVW
jgi:hypothetical protein